MFASFLLTHCFERLERIPTPLAQSTIRVSELARQRQEAIAQLGRLRALTVAHNDSTWQLRRRKHPQTPAAKPRSDEAL